MKRNRLACVFLFAAGMVVGLAVFAQYACEHPESWSGRTVHRLARVLTPSKHWTTLSDPVSLPAPVVEHDFVLADASPLEDKTATTDTLLVRAPEVVEVLEPIVIEPPLAEPRTGVEESELPALGVPVSPTQALPRRMPLADEPRPTSWRSCILTDWVGALQSAFGCQTPAPATLLPPTGDETSSYHEKETSMLPPYCSGNGACPIHYRAHELPRARPFMPTAK